jgi:hypothetical protein
VTVPDPGDFERSSAGDDEMVFTVPIGNMKLYKHFYFEGQEEIWRNEEGNGKKRSIKQAWQGLDGRNAALMLINLPSNPRQACFFGRGADNYADIQTHFDGQASGCFCGHPQQLANY